MSTDGDFTTNQSSANFWGENGLQVEVSYDQDEDAHKVIAIDKSTAVGEFATHSDAVVLHRNMFDMPVVAFGTPIITGRLLHQF